MDPFIEGISDIQETLDLINSRTTGYVSPRSTNVNFTYQSPSSNHHDFEDSLLNDPQEQEQESISFFSLRQYVQRTLATWGLNIGSMHESQENMKTLKCFMQIISQKQRESESREKLKQSLSQSQFQKKKYQSLLEQAKNNNDEKNKKIGKLENNFSELKAKLKKLEEQSKKERDEDKKMIGMLKSKNEQILHEVKKREQEVTKVKEQMKKNIGEKNVLKNVNFEVYEAPGRVRSDETADKINILTERFETEKKSLVRQNLLLKEKLYDIRNQIVAFAEWIDVNIFGTAKPNYQNKFIVNHNLLFRKECIVDQFNEIIEDAKHGIKQVMSRSQIHPSEEQTNSSMKSLRKNNNSKEPENTRINLAASERIIPKKEQNFEKTPLPNRDTLPFQRKMVKNAQETAQKQKTSSEMVILKKSTKQEQPLSKLISPISPKHQNQKQKQQQQQQQLQQKQVESQSQISMISHISMNDMMEGNKKFDKWDILFNHDDEDDEDIE